jgi:hypothetical protein
MPHNASLRYLGNQLSLFSLTYLHGRPVHKYFQETLRSQHIKFYVIHSYSLSSLSSLTPNSLFVSD